MLDLPVSGYTWATFAVVLLSAIVTFFASRSKRKQEKLKNVADAKAQYKEALETKTPEQIIAAKRKLHRVKCGKSVVLLILACFLTTSCASNRDSFIPVGEYIRTPLEGEVVPALPKGEKRWILMSVPTGSDLLIERD